jgi:hypothetical protein
MAQPGTVTVTVELDWDVVAQWLAPMVRSWRNHQIESDRDERAAFAAFVEDGGDPWEVERIEQAFGIEDPCVGGWRSRLR